MATDTTNNVRGLALGSARADVERARMEAADAKAQLGRLREEFISEMSYVQSLCHRVRDWTQGTLYDNASNVLETLDPGNPLN